MRILHAIPSLDPATGGPPMVAAALAAAQATLGCSTAILSYDFPEARSRTESARQTVPGLLKVELHYLPPITRAEHVLATNAFQQSSQLVQQVDLVHLHGVWDPFVRAVGRSATAAGKPYVLTTHGAIKPWALTQGRWKKKIALAVGWKRLLNDAKFLHFLTQEEQALAAPLKLHPPGRVFPNGVFPQEFAALPGRSEFRTAHKLGDAPLILFLGRLHFSKGLDFLADAFARLRRDVSDVRLVIAGPDVGYLSTLQQKIQQLAISDAVTFTGLLYGQQKLAALPAADAFCLPSRTEGFSMATVEAMACGLPVVISRSCHFPEVVQAGAGLIVDLDANAIQQALRSILCDRAAARRMGDAGRALVMQRYTWPKIAQDMLDAYAQI